MHDIIREEGLGCLPCGFFLIPAFEFDGLPVFIHFCWEDFSKNVAVVYKITFWFTILLEIVSETIMFH